MNLGIEGKTALVTGASRGLGFHIAAHLAAEGANVLICARGETSLVSAAEALDKDHPGRIHHLVCDVTELQAADSLAEVAESRFGRVDILINNAGQSARSAFLEIDSESLWHDLELKYLGPSRIAQKVLPGMVRRGWGRIINMCSYLAKNPASGSLPTAGSRAAELAMTKVLAREFGRYGVTVNAVCLGFVRSDQLDRRAASSTAASSSEYYADLASQVGIPAGRVGNPEEVADAVAFLASMRSSYVNGTAVHVDGGLSHSA